MKERKIYTMLSLASGEDADRQIKRFAGHARD